MEPGEGDALRGSGREFGLSSRTRGSESSSEPLFTNGDHLSLYGLTTAVKVGELVEGEIQQTESQESPSRGVADTSLGSDAAGLNQILIVTDATDGLAGSLAQQGHAC